MVIKNTDGAESEDYIENIHTVLEKTYNTTRLCENATVTDFTYTHIQTDFASDSTGYNNTIASGDYYTSAEDSWLGDSTTSNDDFGEADFTSEGTYTLKKTIDYDGVKVVTDIDNELKGYSSGGDDATSYCKYLFYYYDGTTEWSNIESQDEGSYVAHNYVNPSPTKLVTKIEKYMKRTGVVEAVWAKDTEVDATGFVDGTIVTSTDTIAAGVNYIYVYCDYDLLGTSTITIDVSTDGGTTWDNGIPAYNNTPGTLIKVLGGTSLVLRFNLNIGEDSSETPIFRGYSYMTW